MAPKPGVQLSLPSQKQAPRHTPRKMVLAQGLLLLPSCDPMTEGT